MGLGGGGVGLMTGPRKVFQNKLHSSADQNAF